MTAQSTPIGPTRESIKRFISPLDSDANGNHQISVTGRRSKINRGDVSFKEYPHEQRHRQNDRPSRAASVDSIRINNHIEFRPSGNSVKYLRFKSDSNLFRDDSLAKHDRCDKLFSYIADHSWNDARISFSCAPI